MIELTLYEEAMCCSTGVCGPDPDDELVEVSAALDQLEEEFEVLAAAEAFGEELAESQSDGASSEFETVLGEYNDAVSEPTGLNYGSICSTDDCC